MIFDSSEFVFKPAPELSRARRILIKPCASYPVPYPVTTSPEILTTIIEGIREISDADILILEGTPDGSPVYPIYQAIGYNFPRVLMLDVKDSIWVEVDNPLPKPYIVPTFWVPNVILSSDYLISVAPLRIIEGRPSLSIMNLLTALPPSKYTNGATSGWDALNILGLDKVIADLYFTLPFDVGIIEARQKFTGDTASGRGKVEEFGKVFVGEPFEVDSQVTEELGLKPEYLDLIKAARSGFEV